MHFSIVTCYRPQKQQVSLPKCNNLHSATATHFISQLLHVALLNLQHNVSLICNTLYFNTAARSTPHFQIVPLLECNMLPFTTQHFTAVTRRTFKSQHFAILKRNTSLSATHVALRICNTLHAALRLRCGRRMAASIVMSNYARRGRKQIASTTRAGCPLIYT